MRILGAALAFFLLLAAPAEGAGPQLICRAEPGQKEAVMEVGLDLWITGQGAWQLRVECSPGLAFLDERGELTSAGPLLTGSGGFRGSIPLKLFCQLPWRAGVYQSQLELALEGAWGVVGLGLGDEYYIVPLNQKLLVEEGGDMVQVAADQWFLLEREARVFSGSGEMLLGQPNVQAAAFGGQAEPREKLHWVPPSLNLEAGERALVHLLLEGPAPPSILVVQSSPGLQVSALWSLAGKELTAATGAGGLRLELPALPEGLHELRGSVQALLPWEEKTASLKVLWRGGEADLAVHINRGWFGQGLQRINVQGSGALLLPQGRLASAGRPLEMPGGKLDVLLPLDSPGRPIWVGLPLAEAEEWTVLPSREQWTGALPVLLWDDGLTWRVLARGESWLFYGGHGGLRFSWGPFHLESSSGRVAASFSTEDAEAAGSWRWRRSPLAYHGSGQQGSWRWHLELPLEAGQVPTAFVQYRRGKWSLGLAAGDVQLHYGGDTWVWRASWRERSVQLAKGDGSVRFQLKPGRLQARWRLGTEGTLRAVWDAEGLELNFAQPPWEGYLKAGGSGPELGIRFRRAQTKGNWQWITWGTGQLKEGRVLLEAGQALGYKLTSWCTLYGEGVLKLDAAPAFRGQLGAVFRPAPELAAALGWDSQGGLFWKAGLVLPLRSRRPQQ